MLIKNLFLSLASRKSMTQHKLKLCFRVTAGTEKKVRELIKPNKRFSPLLHCSIPSGKFMSYSNTHGKAKMRSRSVPQEISDKKRFTNFMFIASVEWIFCCWAIKSKTKRRLRTVRERNSSILCSLTIKLCVVVSFVSTLKRKFI